MAFQNEFDRQWIDQENSWFKPPHYLQACTADVSTHRWCCLQNNQLLIKSYVELQDNSKYWKITTTGSHITANLSWTNFRLGWNKNCKLDSIVCKFHHWHSCRQVLYWLSGLTCNDENFIQKSGGQRAAAANGIALVCMDTSPSEFSHLHNLVWILNISVGQCVRGLLYLHLIACSCYKCLNDRKEVVGCFNKKLLIVVLFCGSLIYLTCCIMVLTVIIWIPISGFPKLYWWNLVLVTSVTILIYFLTWNAKFLHVLILRRIECGRGIRLLGFWHR